MNETNTFEELIVMRSKSGDGTIYRQRPLVRCKDCKYWHETIYDTPKWMPCMYVQTSGNWFCADGERRESE